MRYLLPNPSTPRALRPVDTITDRAKRYRANANPPEGPRVCAFCTSRRSIDIDHIDGDERNGSRRNLEYLCRSCNAKKAVIQKAAGAGRRTSQYNPEPAPSFKKYVDSILILRGNTAGDVHRAAQTLQATPPAKRREFGERIAAAINPEPASPSYAQYAYAVAIHTRGAHDEGGKIIHATPKATRSKYARQIAAGKRKKARSSTPRDDVPF